MVPSMQFCTPPTVVQLSPPPSTKVALTFFGAFSVIVHTPAPLQSPDQPPNAEPLPGAATRLTVVPTPKLAEHVDPQSRPVGFETTVPAPLPTFFTVTAYRSV